MASPVAALRALQQIIATSIDRIEESCKSRGLDFPSLDEPFTPENDAARADPVVQEASTLLAAAAHQLVATVQQPQKTIFTATVSYYLPVALRAAVETNTVEILREVGEQGLHVNDIAQKNNVDPVKLGRLLRFLATSHIFKEVSPDVFANNRLSSVCDTGKATAELFEKPLEKHESTSGIPALIGHCTDEDYKGAGYILEHLTDRETAFEDGLERTPMMRAFGSTTDVWTWFERPDNELRFRRFGAAMNGVNNMQSPESILKGFDWGSLSEGSIIVDVGGGIGTSSLVLAKAFPKLRYVVQDRPAVVEEGKKHCQSVLPEALAGRTVQYEAHDFFQKQPQKTASVFLLKQIMHDWSDRFAANILRRLRDAATPETRLVLIDNIMPYACRADDLSIPGAKNPDVPEPLLPNMGGAGILPYCFDLSMYVHFNALERTLGHLQKLLESAGWKLARVYPTDSLGSYLPQVEAVPA
ncbi:S-adenosyl-L-methionine-dependent methyltransferase [Obba rivulosa]|uniref:S-adenosyl-L-methionine-dependent methyltransferase n=1 Tax=Obba rivulosa TaxID=1052685 RepID=A0A8E2ASW2_9APHY|nr:S-adenosyl-L-methionine-dependent methyltransferase [Obba rivulosa]